MLRHWIVVASFCFVGASCTDPTAVEDAPLEMVIVGVPALDGEVPRGVYVITPADPEAVPPTRDDYTYAGATIIFMNRMGGTYTPGFNDARTNRSTIPSFTASISPWGVSDANWDFVMGCVQDAWSPFNVIITDVDPGDVPHFESVVAGYPGDVGMSSGVGGVSPFTSDCSVIPNSIVFTFAEVYGSNYQAVCETVAQEVAHSFGLDHEYMCEDPMTYLGGCGEKTFQNTAALCGEYSARTCACGGSTQNSVAMLTSRIGAADTVAPTVAITAPTDGATVAPGFTVSANAADDTGVYSVALIIDGATVDIALAPPYTFTVDPGIADGVHTVTTTASDGFNEATATIQVTVDSGGDPGDPPDDPPDDPDSDDPPDDPDPGDPDPDDPDPDPEDPGAQGDLVGGCSTGGGSDGAGFLLMLFAMAIAGRKRTHL